VDSFMKRVVLGLVRFYQMAISPALPMACRYVPTCSEYCCEAVERHGAVSGLWLAARRLLRCHPFHPGGYDPVPTTIASPAIRLATRRLKG
jgi:putative membrane protein insertion efficiency factor